MNQLRYLLLFACVLVLAACGAPAGDDMASGQTASEQTASEQTASIQTASDNTASDITTTARRAINYDMLGEVTVGYVSGWPTPNQVAQLDETYDEALGVKVNWVPFDTGVAMSAAMASDDVQIAYSQGLVPFANAVSAGVPLKLVGVAAAYSENANCVVGSHTGITLANVMDLHGQQVAVPFGTVAHYKALRQFEYFGVDVEQLQLVDMTPAVGAEALERGEVAMACAWGGALQRMKRSGAVLMSGAEMEEIGIQVFDVVSVTEDFATEHGDLVAKFLQVTEEANAAYAADPTAKEDVIAEAAGMEVEDSNAILGLFSFPTTEEQLSEAWLGGTVQTLVKEVAEFLVEQGELEAALDDYAPTIDTSFLEALK